MSVQGVTGGTIPGLGEGRFDSTDLAFTVMEMQIEMLDGEICGRLEQMDQINELRKAYNERMVELRDYLQNVKSGRVDVPVELLESGQIEWDPAANDGRGGPVMVSEGKALALGDGVLRVQLPDGTLLTYDQIVRLRSEESTSSGGTHKFGSRAFGHEPYSTGGGEAAEEISREDAAASGSGTDGSTAYRSLTLEDAQALAEEFGGKVVANVSAEVLKCRIDVLQEQSENLGSDAEVGMLSLNRLLSRRNQALQLASNVMAANNQTAMGIIANMKV